MRTWIEVKDFIDWSWMRRAPYARAT